MCVIASIPAGKDINNDTIDRMWKRNPDGGGISWIEDGKVQVFKTMELIPFKQKFKEVLSKYGDSDILVHMRIATHGSVCIENNHPFYIDTQTVFAHNGIMPSEFHPPAKSDLSDTRYFNQLYRKNRLLCNNRNRFFNKYYTSIYRLLHYDSHLNLKRPDGFSCQHLYQNKLCLLHLMFGLLC